MAKKAEAKTKAATKAPAKKSVQPASALEKENPSIDTGPAKRLAKAAAKADTGNAAQQEVHAQLDSQFDAIRATLKATADDKHPRQLRWALKHVDAAHVAAKSHVDRNVGVA